MRPRAKTVRNFHKRSARNLRSSRVATIATIVRSTRSNVRSIIVVRNFPDATKHRERCARRLVQSR